jgi:hypothetical protein
MIIRLSIGFLFTLISCVSSAQSLSNLSFGTDSTFEVAAWNIEWFPKNGQTSVNSVGEIIGALNIDVWALQEIDDSSKLKQSIASLSDYKAVFGGPDSRGLAYVYNTKTISNVKSFRLFDEAKYSSPLPRAPFVLEFTYQDSVIRIVDNHYKCCGNGVWDKSNTGDEENRRYLGHRLIMDYIDSLWSKDNVILAGDLNDILTDDRNNNIFQNELTNSRQYRFVDLPIEESNNVNWSYPSWPSHLDHILICGPLLKQFNKPTTKVQCIKVEKELAGGWSEYDRNISDHRPVAYKFDFKATNNIKDTIEAPNSISTTEKARFKVFPNPSKGLINIQQFEGTEITEVVVRDLSGKLITTKKIEGSSVENSSTIQVNKPGVYLIQLLFEGTLIYSDSVVISE